MGCRKQIARQIIDSGGDYVLAVKENQPTLHAAIVQHFAQLHETNFADCDARHLTTQDKAHGRQEQRSYHLVPLPEAGAPNTLVAVSNRKSFLRTTLQHEDEYSAHRWAAASFSSWA